MDHKHNDNFSERTRKLLHDSGWTEDRSVDTDQLIKTLREHYKTSEIIEKFLQEFAGLIIVHPHAKVPKKKDYFRIGVTPEEIQFSTKEVERYSRRIGSPLCIIGSAFRDHMTMTMTPEGRVYAGFGDSIVRLGDSGADAIEALCTGRELRKEPILEQGHKGPGGFGIEYIISTHGESFSELDITKGNIEKILSSAVRRWKITGRQGRSFTRPIYSNEHEGKVIKLAILSGNSGRIIAAYPIFSTKNTNKIKVFADYTCHPLWLSEPGINLNINPKRLPLSDRILLRLERWAQSLDDWMDFDDPPLPASDLPSNREIENFNEEGMDITRQLQKELGSSYEVFFFPHESRNQQ